VFGGYAWGVTKVVAAPVRFVYNTAYNVTGGAAFAITGRQEFRDQYQALESVTDTIGSVHSGGDALRLAGRVVTAPIKQSVDAFDRGDLFEVGSGLGETVSQVALAGAAAGGKLKSFGDLPPPRAPELAYAVVNAEVRGGAAALAGGPPPGSLVPPGWLLAQGANASGGAVTTEEGASATQARPASQAAGKTAAERIAERVEAMKAAMTPGEMGRTTYSAAEVTTPSGETQTWVSAAGKKGYVPPRIRGGATVVVRPGRPQDQGLPHINDAERALLREARRQGATVDAIGATRRMCDHCTVALKKAGQAEGIVE
jgi:hypothetical protein